VNGLPRNGIYILFEAGETAHGTDRIVRVGTHTGQNQLRSRLRQHFVKENKDRSIFRKNIGRSLLNKEQDLYLSEWEIDLTTRKAKQEFASRIDPVKQRSIERRVSDYVRNNLTFVVFRVDDKVERLYWESRLISTLSRCDDCRPSGNWLGQFSPKHQIRDSGLWLVNELYKEALTQEDMARLESRLIHTNA
jgi:hypothetical protein